MAAERRISLDAGRELVVSEGRVRGLVVVSIHARGLCVSGPLAVRLGDVETLRSALLDLLEPPAEEATG